MDKSTTADNNEQNIQPDVLTEGKAKILLEKKNVFYNPVQQFNRDLSIAVLTEYSKERSNSECEKKKGAKNENSAEGLRILEALSATGLRSIRYAKEVPGINIIVANDISAQAVEAIKRNVAYNEVENIVQPHNDDATMVMYQNRKTKFDVVDLDPYGCPSTFLDGAVQCLKDNGLLLVTATDMAVLAGNSPETCYVKYGAVSLKSKSCHEMALRILLQHIASHAGRYGKVIVPVLSISADFYIRVFVKLHSSQMACKRNTSNLGLVYQCVGCESITIQPLGTTNEKNTHKLPQAPVVDKLCSFCKHKHHMGGPIWTGPLHNKDFVQKILNAIDSEEDNHLKKLACVRRIQGILHVVNEELDIPLYYQLDRLTSVVKLQVPPMIQFRSAILNAGYRVSYSHAHKTSIKTDAPNQLIWDIVRALERGNPIKREKLEAASAGLAILNGESVTQVSFQRHADAVPFSQRQKLTRFQLNPTAHWGPGTRSTTIIQEHRQSSKQERNQNKHKKRKRGEEEEAAVESCREDKKTRLDDESVA
ncbi:tRNA (guanine(26)-N(2))-dimethyltransferase [Phymastichus coffea]|uniref:tRNA (guanine(26)-N(2))-dimethyltransferase n=1 Tax=Phymastichus coffea TaxID=108790 RepID=UPI00273BC398|nr:tRNA (guanine(26)-N(2))-dimethyltransferase [Phymastichus coffea]